MIRRVGLYGMMLVMLMAANALAVETKDIKFSFKSAEPVVFSHAFHLEKYRNNCRICHNTLYDLRKRQSYTMADMEKGKSCGACHSGMKAFSVATEKDCSRCHRGKPREVTYKAKGAGDTVFSHAIHIAKTGGACKSCHNGKVITGKDKRVTMAEMEKGKTCGACHNGKPTFTVAGNCNRCHKGLKTKEITFTVKGATPVKFSHEFHTQAYQCTECHTKLFQYRKSAAKTMADMEKGMSCGACHNDGKAAFSVVGNCDKCHPGYKPGEVKFKTMFGDVAFSHDFHTQVYKCADCHTKVFRFKAFTSQASMNDMAKGKSCGTCHNKGKDAFPVDGDCVKCHKK